MGKRSYVFRGLWDSHQWNISVRISLVYTTWYILCGIYYVVYTMWYILCGIYYVVYTTWIGGSTIMVHSKKTN